MNDNNLNNNGQIPNGMNPIPGMEPQNNFNPVTPEVPVQPSFNSVTPEVPMQPSFNPVTPEVPSQPSFNPVTPEGPSQPSFNPVTPEVPMQPSFNPVTPEVPMQPSFNSVTPEVPVQPSFNPATPEVPAQPNYNSMSQNNMSYGAVPQQPKKPINKNLILIIAAVAVVAVIVVLFATGIIGGKTLTCTTEETSMGMTMKEEIKIRFKGDKANKVVARMTIDYGDNAEYKEYLESMFEEELEGYKEDGINAKIESGKTSTTLVVTAEKKDLEDAFGIYEDDGTSYSELKEYYEDDGYTCK